MSLREQRPRRVGGLEPRSGTVAAPLLARVGDGPLLSPTNRWWESVAVFNPAAAEGEDGTIHVLYRAQGTDGVSRLGYAATRDAVTIGERYSEPVFEPDPHDEYERYGVEDPRMVRLGNTYYVLYVAASRHRVADPHVEHLPESAQSWRPRVALAITKNFRTFTRLGTVLPGMDNKDAALFPEKIGGMFVLLHRLPPDIWLAISPDLKRWEEHRVILRTRPALWDESKLGAGPPPVRTDQGWLLCYHGIDHHSAYRAGFALLDPRDPSRVLARSAEPALEPAASWEVKGQMPRVVFPTGMVVRGDDLFLYYGAADTVVGIAKGSVRAILASLW